MAAATSSGASTLPMKHPGSERTRKRIDPRTRQAALSFLSNISLDGRPVQDEADGPDEEGDEPPEARTRRSLVSPERSVACGAAGAAAAEAAVEAVEEEEDAAAAATTAAQALAFANQALLSGGRAGFGTGAEGDAFLPATFGSPFSAVPASTRGRLQTYTQGVLPVPFARQSSQTYSLDGVLIANSAMELQRSR